MDTSPSEMSQRIRQIMEANQMSQQDFAKILYISPASLSSIFNERTRPTNNHTLAIHKAFPNISINWLLFGEGSMYENSESPAANPSPSTQNSLFPEVDESQKPVVRNTPGVAQPTPYYNKEQIQSKEQYIIANNFDKKKRMIKEIRVFYDDGTYESFSPQK